MSGDAERVWVVMPAAGIGRRFGDQTPKQYQLIAGVPVICHSLRPFLRRQDIAGIVVAIAEDDSHWSSTAPASQRLFTTRGGDERCESVLNGLDALAEKATAADWVLVHDAARPCLASRDLDRLMLMLKDDSVGGLLAIPVSDTVKRASVDGHVVETIDRTNLWQAQTPQMFRYGLLRAALGTVVGEHAWTTDEAEAMERAGHQPLLVPGSASNMKITSPDDLVRAETILTASGAA